MSLDVAGKPSGEHGATFGMPRKSAPDAVERFVEIKDIVDAAKMYALVALEICGARKS